MEIPATNTQQGEFEVTLTDPAEYDAPSQLEPFWHSLEFVSSLPLIKASIGTSGKRHNVRLMIDSGLTYPLTLNNAYSRGPISSAMPGRQLLIIWIMFYKEPGYMKQCKGFKMDACKQHCPRGT